MVDRYRTHKYTPTPLVQRTYAPFVYPQSPGVMRYLAEKLRNQTDGQLEAKPIHEAVNRRVDQPLWGQTAVMPRDERDQKDEAPLVFVDNQPGKTPIALINLERLHWRDCKDLVDEHRHYDTGRLDRDVAPPDMNDVFQQWVSRALDAQVGRKRFFFQTDNWI